MRVIDDLPLDTLAPYIDWSPFFMAWELKGKYPDIFKDPTAGKEARELFDKAQAMLATLLKRHTIQGRKVEGAFAPIEAKGVYGFFPANSDGDDIVIYTDESRSHEACRMPMLRQQWEREGQTSFRSLADYRSEERRVGKECRL